MPKLHKLQHLNQKLRPIQQMLLQAFLEVQEVVVWKDSLVEPQMNQQLNYQQHQNLKQLQKILLLDFWEVEEATPVIFYQSFLELGDREIETIK